MNLPKQRSPKARFGCGSPRGNTSIRQKSKNDQTRSFSKNPQHSHPLPLSEAVNASQDIGVYDLASEKLSFLGPR